MNIYLVRKFTVTTSVDEFVRVFTRNSFQESSRDAFVFERRDCKGNQINKFFVLESTAQLSLDHALKLQESQSGLVSVEIEKFSAGISFNYPVPHV